MSRSLFSARTLAPALLLLAAGLIGCQRDKVPSSLEGVNVDVQFAPQPPKVGPAKVTIKLAGPGSKPLEGAAIKLEGNMNHAGMKPVFADATEIKPGSYEATLELTMGGDWFVLVDVALADGRRLRQKVDLPGVKSR
jgi:hypothetical protein